MSKFATMVLVAVAIGLFTSSSGEACKCVPHNPKDLPIFCRTKFLALVNITGVQTIDSKMVKHYRFELVEDVGKFRGNTKCMNLERAGWIETASVTAACGVELEVGETYLLGGGGRTLEGLATVNACQGYVHKAEPGPGQLDAVKQLLKAC